MLDNLYENIGGNIKNWAKWIFIIEAIGAIITGLVLLFADEDLILYGLLTLVCGPIVAWVGSWLLYAFGEMVQDIHTIKIQISKIHNIDRNLHTIAQPIIDKANETAKHEANERAKQQAEAIAKRSADEKAKHNADEKVNRETNKNTEQIAQKKEKTISEKLEYALMFQSDDGMVRYLKDIQDETIQNILKSPTHLIREQIRNLLSNM